jgi:hypothetical protein
VELADERLARIAVDGQELFVPSEPAWKALWDEPQLDGRKLPVPDLLRNAVRRNAQYPELVSALGFAWDRTHFYELLNFGDELYRVFVEAVICEFCGHRAIASATPGVMDIYWGAKDETTARERGYSLPRQSCHACKSLLERRRTVWQVN